MHNLYDMYIIIYSHIIYTMHIVMYTHIYMYTHFVNRICTFKTWSHLLMRAVMQARVQLAIIQHHMHTIFFFRGLQLNIST